MFVGTISLLHKYGVHWIPILHIGSFEFLSHGLCLSSLHNVALLSISNKLFSMVVLFPIELHVFGIEQSLFSLQYLVFKSF